MLRRIPQTEKLDRNVENLDSLLDLTAMKTGRA